MRNRYNGYCYKCGNLVKPGFGFFEKNHGQFQGGKWRVQCVKCCDGRTVKETDPEVKAAKRKGGGRVMERLTYWCDDGMGGGEYRVNENGTEYSGPSIKRLAVYENTGLTPEGMKAIKTALMGKSLAEIKEINGLPVERMIELAEAEHAGRLVVLDDRTALAIAAGARAIRENKRLVGSKYVYDVFGKNGGPYEISYHEASEILAAIWDAYPLPEPSGGDA